MKAFIAVLGKELLEFMRLPFLVLLILYIFTIEIYVAGAGITLEAKNISVGVVDYTPRVISTKILNHLHAPHFQHPIHYTSQEKLFEDIKNKKIMVGIVFESDFEKNVYKNGGAKLNLLLDTTASAQAFLAHLYLQNILYDFQKVMNLSPIIIDNHKLFNPNAEFTYFMSITELLAIISLLSVLLSAMVFVNEKENGTWDLMLLMPVNTKTIILAKILSQVLIIMAGTIMAVGLIIFAVFDSPFNGSFSIFLLLTFLYAFTSAGIGLFVAAVSETIMEVAQLAILIMMPMIFLSGAWTPVYAMHPVLEALSYLSPLRYYIEGAQSIFFRGTDVFDLWPYFLGVMSLGSILFWLGVRKIGKLF
ncbi:MAG: ABC transporter permease [Campylobacterota bacterium]|nr:ABC transporter permease [Campylobacterota bacterium]